MYSSLATTLYNFIPIAAVEMIGTLGDEGSAFFVRFMNRIRVENVLSDSFIWFTNLPPFLIFSPYNQLVLPAHLQLSLSNALQIPLGSKFLTDLSTFKRLHFGMLYHTIFALILILLNLILFSRYFLLNSTTSWKLTFFFIPILLSLSSLYWSDPLELRFGPFVIHFSFHILHPFICSTRFNFMFVI